MSTIEVNKITPVSGGTTVQVGESGDTINIPAGATIANAGTATGFGVSLANGADNRVVTASSASALNGEANLTFDGSALTVKPGSNVNQLKLEQNNATDYWSLHADSSGGPLSFNRYTGGAETERMNISSTGELAVTSSDSASGTQTLKVATTGNANPAYTNLVFKTGGNTSGCWIKGVQASGGNDGRLEFHVNNAGTVTEAMRMMYNGNWIQGTASTGSDGRQYTFGSSISSYRAGTADAYHMVFFNANGEIGRIRTSGSSTAYNTSSDYRLKENEVAISDGIARLKQLKPYRFNFKTDADTTVDGFFAHEVTPVVPEAISGDKDAMHPEVLYTDKDELPEGKEIGDVKEATKINPQAIDQSKLVPLLTSALQEAITKIETLEAKVAALEAD